MVRKLTPQSSLDNLKREAKRWLAELRDSDPDRQRTARERLERATPNVPAVPSLRDIQLAIAREYGFDGWRDLKARLGKALEPSVPRAELVARFIENACPDHHVRGGPAHTRAWHTARRLLERYPDLAQESFYTAIVCGDLDRVRRELVARPAIANEKGGPKGWEPILYLAFSRAPVPAASENAVAVATALLDAAADPNVHFMAGGSRYTPLVGVIGEGEEERAAHAHRNELVQLLLDRGANPFDIQVIYNTGFKGEMLWFLQMIYAESVKRGQQSAWDDPEWQMLGMGGYGTGARWMLRIAVRDNNLPLARWCLDHGANPNAGPERARNMSHQSLYEQATRKGLTEMVDLLVRHGANQIDVAVDDLSAFRIACFRLDENTARAMLARHPEFLNATGPIFDAATQDRVDVVQFLLDLGVSVNVEDAEKQRPLHMAAYANSLRVAQLLIDRGAEIDPVESNWSNTPLGAAVWPQHREMIELLSRYSRDVWELTYVGALDRLRELLRGDPNLAKTGNDGWTLLMWLPPEDEANAIVIAELLLVNGADPTAKNKEGETAADRAAKAGMFELAALLNTIAAE